LLLENTGNTFVTPVFNGSASLRNAAGQLIESVTKAFRRGKALDYPALYDEVTSLYHLDEIIPEKEGPLPKDAIFLIAGLGICWFCITFSVAFDAYKKRSKKKQEKY